MNHSSERPSIRRPIIWILMLLLILFLVSLGFFVRALLGFHEGPGHPPRNPFRMFISSEQPPPIATENIEGWMTFEFINRANNLPPAYLKDTLNIQDTKYPRITLDRLAKKSGFQKADYLEMVKRAIDLYPGENTEK